jgi:hypothetical protein
MIKFIEFMGTWLEENQGVSCPIECSTGTAITSCAAS